VDRPVSGPQSGGLVVAKEAAASVKAEPTTDKAWPAVLPAEQMRSPKPAVPGLALISEEAILEAPVEKAKPEPEAKTKDEGAHEAPPPPARFIPAMFIVMIAPELAPVAKVGGLADVVFGLARELESRGNAVEIILPKYNCMRYDHIWGLTTAYERLWVPWYSGAIETTVWFGTVHGRKCFFIDPHSRENFFNRGAVYGQHDDMSRF